MLEEEKEEKNFPLLMNKKKLKKKDFLELFKQKNKIFSKGVIFFFKQHNDLIIKTATKKAIGKAWLRNYRKRRLKNILNNLRFKENLFILAVITRNEVRGYEEEQKKIEKLLKPILV